MKAVILAAGLGTRFLPATKAQPKEMLPLLDIPTIQFIVEEAVDSGIEDILIIVGRGESSIENHFDRCPELEHTLEAKGKTDLLKEVKRISELGNIHYIRQSEARGLGDAVYHAKDHIGNEPFVVLLGDDLVFHEDHCTKQLVKCYEKYQAPVIAVEEVDEEMIPHYGIIDAEEVEDRVYKVKNLVEKPSVEEAPSKLGITGKYILTPEIFKAIEKTKPGKGGEIQLTDALRILKEERDIYAYRFKGKRYDIGHKKGFLKATIEYALRRDDFRDWIKEYLRDLVKRDFKVEE